MNIFFDVLDTLHTEDGDPRPYAREVFFKLDEMGHNVYLWSTAGDGYAAHAASLLGVDDVIKGCFSKSWLPEEVRVDYAVDDDARYVERYGGFLVSPYQGDPYDWELLDVVEPVESSRSDRR